VGEQLALGMVDEDELYSALDWLAVRQPAIEAALAKRHFTGGTLVLYASGSDCCRRHDEKGAADFAAMTPRDIARLRFIRRARQLGFSFDEIRGLPRLATSDEQDARVEARSLAVAHVADIRAKIADLQAMERVLADAICECEAGRADSVPINRSDLGTC
jgi:hypothetical protein